jgi:hypothetical protein
MNRPRLMPLGLTLLATACLAACGTAGDDRPPAAATANPAAVTPEKPTTNPATSTSTPAAADACSLVSKQEAEQVAGTPLDPPLAVRETCTYTGPVTGPTAQVEIFVGPGAKKYLDIEREIGHELRPLAGIGDEAYAEDEAVFLSKAGQWVSIRLVRLNDPQENRKPLEDLARKVATRI